MRRVLAIGMLMAVVGWSQDPAALHEKLRQVRRIHIEKLEGSETAEQIRAMIIASLQRTGRFILTENPERADAFLRGTAEDLVYTDTHESRDGVDARGAISLGSSSRSSSRRSGGVYMNSSVGENDMSRSVERKHEATAAVRLVDRDGDVLWSTVQESRGAKFHGASADVADKITRQLLKDLKRPRNPERLTEPAGGRKRPPESTAPPR